MAKSSKAKTAKEYLLNPDKDPIKAATALYGKYRGSNFISAVDAVVRGSFSLSTSIIKGTFNFTTTVAKNINTKARVTERIKNVTSTLIGTENTDNMINYVDQARVEMFKGYEAAAKQIAQAATGDPNSNYKDIILQGSSKVIKNMKIAANAATGINFDVRDMIKNAVVVDIETGGLFKDAPIIQLAMTDVAKMADVKKMTAKEIASMNPLEQIQRGFLEMNLLPEAIIRDTTGDTKTFKMFGYMPRSAEEFGRVFGSWAVQKNADGTSKFKLHEFYEEMADEVMADGSKRISDARYAEIMQKAEAQGFIELANGQRFYSQREAAKWSMYYSKMASKENKSLIAANLSFESFRIGKLWNYFIKDTVGPATGTDRITNLQLAPGEVNFLNADQDLLRAFGKDAVDEITGHREVREMLMASWKSKFKLNILDENNYYFVDKFNKLRDLGESNKMIGLFPEWIKRTGGGLKTADQLQLTKMLFSGLMQTGFSPMGNDVFSGTKIDFATQTILGEVEAHTALSDVFHQTQLLTEGKLGDTVADVYNIFKAQESSSMRDQIKSFFSAGRILTDNKKKVWFDLDTIFRQTQITVEDPRLKVLDNGVSKALMYHGSATEVTKQWNIDKELMRISETVDAWTGIGTSVFSEQNMESASILKEVEYEDGTKEVKRFYTSGKEPFSLGQTKGRSRHEMLTQDGTSLHVGYKQHDYDLQKRVEERFAELTSGGMEADDARKHIKDWLAEEYAETPGMKGTGRTASDVKARLNDIMQMLPGGALGDELKDRMEGGAKRFSGRVMEQLRPQIDRAAALAQSEATLSGKFFSDMGAGVKDILSGNKRISDITLDSIRNLPESFVGKTFNVDSNLAAFAVRAGGRVAGLGLAAIGIGAGLGLGYMIDEPSWKKTTGDILRMTGQEREILPEAHYQKAGNLSQVTQSFTGPVDQTNPDGIALRAIDESKVDYAVGDGDTIQILSKGFLGFGRKSLGSVRVAGIDTPEVAHGGESGGPGDMPYAQPGKNYLSNVLSARTGATVAIGTRETYGRAVGLVTDKEGINYSYQMIQQGLASALYREKRSEDLMNQSAFNAAENVARKSEKGMWAQPFYYGAQANIDPRDRVGWNKMTPNNMAQFHFDRSPGSSQEQSLATLSQMQHMTPDRAINTIGDTVFENSMHQIEKGHLQKSTMADMQQMALMNSMQRNRGRGKDRR